MMAIPASLTLSKAITDVQDVGTYLTLNHLQFKRIELLCVVTYRTLVRDNRTSHRSRLLTSYLFEVHARCTIWRSSNLVQSLVAVPEDMGRFERHGTELIGPQESTPSPQDERSEEENIILAIQNIIQHDKYRSQAMALRGRPAEVFVSHLQTVLDKTPGMDASLREKCIKALRTLAVEAQVLPSSLKIEKVEPESDYAFASGGFFDVYKGSWREKTVAIKRPRIFGSADNTKALKRSRREILLWRQLSHEFVLPLLGVYKDDGRLFDNMVSEWMPNGTLKEFLKQRNLGGPDRLELTGQVSQGISYLHNHKPPVSHGDIKASNVFIDANGRPLLGDFGLSCSHYSTNATRTTNLDSGTVRWMAPELLCPPQSVAGFCSQKPTLKSDVWAFSMLMLEVFTGEVPYIGDSEPSVIIKVAEKRILPGRCALRTSDLVLADRLWELMEECWEFNPVDRPDITYIVRNIHRLSRPAGHDQCMENAQVPIYLVECIVSSHKDKWERLGVKVVENNSSSIGNAVGMATVSITGCTSSVVEARCRILESIEKNGNPHTIDQLRIPKELHGRIVGIKGYVKAMGSKHQVRITFPHHDSSSEEVELVGLRSNISATKAELQKKAIKIQSSLGTIGEIATQATTVVSDCRLEKIRPAQLDVGTEDFKAVAHSAPQVANEYALGDTTKNALPGTPPGLREGHARLNAAEHSSKLHDGGQTLLKKPSIQDNLHQTIHSAATFFGVDGSPEKDIDTSINLPGRIIYFTNEIEYSDLRDPATREPISSLSNIPGVLSGWIKILKGPFPGRGCCDLFSGQFMHDQGVEEAEYVAIKVVRIVATQEYVGKAKKKFQEEARPWGLLQHPNLLPFYGSVDLNGFRLMIVVPWIDGEPSLEYLRRNPFADRNRLLLQISSALEYLHSGRHAPQVVHGGLKAENILISTAGDALLCDYGLPRRVREEMMFTSGSSSTGCECGRACFKAPELLMGPGDSHNISQPNPESDIFAFASLMLQIYTGERPFLNLSEDEVTLKIIRGEPPQRPVDSIVRERGCDDNVWTIMTDCWKFVPCERPNIQDIRERMTGMWPYVKL